MGKVDHFMENRLPECVGTPFAFAEEQTLLMLAVVSAKSWDREVLSG